MGTKVSEGIFVPLRLDTLDALYTVLDREGYAGDPSGVARFLSDVAGGLLDETPDQGEEGEAAPLDALQTAANLARKHGPTVARMAAALLRSRGAT